MATSHSEITLGELVDLEYDFEEVEKEITRLQYVLSKPLYATLANLTVKIPDIWGRVLQKALIDNIEEYIRPFDLELLSHSLRSLSVTRFEIDANERGDPRSVAIRFEFAENEYFEDTVLEKKFWWRQSKHGFAGLVSEPVEIRWKKGRDLTDGLLLLAKAVFDERRGKPHQELTGNQRALEARIDKTDMSGISFFAWFGYIGEYVSAEESRTAIDEEKEERKRRKAGKETTRKEIDDDESGGDGNDSDGLEIFPAGDAVTREIVDNLWPDAVRYIIQAVLYEKEYDDEEGFGGEGGSDDEEEFGDNEESDESDEFDNNEESDEFDEVEYNTSRLSRKSPMRGGRRLVGQSVSQ